MAKKKMIKGTKCRIPLCSGCSLCSKPGDKKKRNLVPEELDHAYKNMNSVDPRLVRQDMSVLFLNPGNQANTALVAAGNWIQRSLKESTGIRGELNEFLNPLPLARLATPSKLWDPSPARGHPRQVRNTGFTAASRGQLTLTSLRLKKTAEGDAKIKAYMSLKGPADGCVKDLFQEDRDFEYLDQVTLLTVNGPFDGASMKQWAAAQLQGHSFTLDVSPYDLWLLEGGQYLRVLFGWRSMVWTPIDLFEMVKSMPPALPNSTAEQILVYITQRTVLQDSLQDEQQRMEDDKEPSGDELEEDSEDELFTWKQVPWSVKKNRKPKPESDLDSWSYTPLPPSFALNTVQEVGAAYQNYKLRMMEKQKSLSKSGSKSLNNNSSAMTNKNVTPAEVEVEQQQKTVMKAHNFEVKPVAPDTPSALKTPGVPKTDKSKNTERSQAKALVRLATGETGTKPKTKIVTSTPSVASTVEQNAQPTVPESSFCPSKYKPVVNRIFPRSNPGNITVGKIEGVSEFCTLLPENQVTRAASSDLPPRWNALASSSNFNKKGRKELHKIQAAINAEKDVNTTIQECQQILAESDCQEVDVFVGQEKDGAAHYLRMSAREALNALQLSGSPLALRSGSQCTALHKVIGALKHSVYQIDMSNLSQAEKTYHKNLVVKDTGERLTRMAEDSMSRESSTESSESSSKSEDKPAPEKSLTEGPNKRSLGQEVSDDKGAAAGDESDNATPKNKKTRKTKNLTVKIDEELGGAGGNLQSSGDPTQTERPPSSHTYESVETRESGESDVDKEDDVEETNETKFNTADQSLIQDQMSEAPAVKQPEVQKPTDQGAAALKVNEGTTGPQPLMPPPATGQGLDHTVGAGLGPGDMSVAVGGPGVAPTLPDIKPLLSRPVLSLSGFGLEHRDPKPSHGMGDSSQEDNSDRGSNLGSEHGE